MNATEYINSGAIEACINGLADEQDYLELQQMEAMYPEVKMAREAMELAIEQAALQGNPAASHDLKGAIQQRLQDEQLLLTGEPQQTAKTAETPAEKKQTLQLPPAPKPIRWFRTALAASVLLLMGSVLLNFYYYSKYTDTETRYDELLAQQNTLLARNNAMETSLKTIMSPDAKPVVMQGTGSRPDLMATVYWEQSSRDVYLLVNNLPAPPKGKQYQLWAEVNGVMVDAGLLTWQQDQWVAKMKNTPRAEAFAISLENEGGSQVPTLAAVVVIGKV